VGASSEPVEPARPKTRRLFADLSPVRSNPAFRRLWIGWAVSALGSQLAIVAVAYQTYTLTHSTFMVGLIGLIQLVPSLVGSLWGGSLADAKDRRAILIGAQFALAAASGGLAINATFRHPSLGVIFGCIVCASAFQAVNLPSRSAIVSQIVAREELASASALMGITNQLALIAGPALAGILIATVGVASAFEVDTATFGAVLLAAVALPRIPPIDGGSPMGVRSVVEGLQYAKRNRFLISLLVVDFNSMVFGMPKAVFPALGLHVYRGGAGTVGLLYSAAGIGALVASMCSGWVGQVHYRGRAVVACMVVWGVAIGLVGLIPIAAIGVALLAIAGGADMIGGIFRNTIWQTTVPIRFQGRLAGVFYGSAIGANSVGDGEAGVAASIDGPLFALWSGGALSLLGIVVVLVRYPELWRSTGHDLVDFDDDGDEPSGSASADVAFADTTPVNGVSGGSAEGIGRPRLLQRRARARRTVGETTGR
jgi:predicted MFS family arabinose efflux permease